MKKLLANIIRNDKNAIIIPKEIGEIPVLKEWVKWFYMPKFELSKINTLLDKESEEIYDDISMLDSFILHHLAIIVHNNTTKSRNELNSLKEQNDRIYQKTLNYASKNF